jgi:hypothetical protein
MSISKLYENIDNLVQRKKQLIVERTESLARTFEAKAAEVRTTTPSIAEHLEWAANAFRQSAHTGAKPPCDDPRVQSIKSISGINIPEKLFGEEDRKALADSWLQEHYPQSTAHGEVRSVRVDETGRIGFTLDPAIEHRTGEVARNISKRMKVGTVCCLIICYSPPW